MAYDGLSGHMLGEAIAAGQLSAIHDLIKLDEINAPLSSSFGDFRALHIAALHGHPAVCEYLLDLGADTSIVADVRRLTPLHCALDSAPTIGKARASALCCELLLKAGAATNVFSRGDQAPLHRAINLIISDPMRFAGLTEPTPIESEAMKIIELLVEYGADPSVAPDRPATDLYAYLTPFQCAVEKNKGRVIKLILDNCEIDFGQRTFGGKTLLQLAKKQGAKDLLRSNKVVRQVRDALDVAPTSASGVVPKPAGMSPL